MSWCLRICDGPKVTFYQERAGRGRFSELLLRSDQSLLIDINAIIPTGNDSRSRSFPCPVDVSEVSAAWTRRAGTNS